MKFNIVSEDEHSGGWTFTAQVTGHDRAEHRFIIRLAWADYNLWSPRGSDRPEAVATAALRFLLDKEPPAEISESFDLARIRRRYPEADEDIPGLIGA